MVHKQHFTEIGVAVNTIFIFLKKSTPFPLYFAILQSAYRYAFSVRSAFFHLSLAQYFHVLCIRIIMHIQVQCIRIICNLLILLLLASIYIYYMVILNMINSHTN
jgi:hypothetical protein